MIRTGCSWYEDLSDLCVAANKPFFIQRLIDVQKELETNAQKSKMLQRDLDAANLRVHGLKTEGVELRTENYSLASVSKRNLSQ